MAVKFEPAHGLRQPEVGNDEGEWEDIPDPQLSRQDSEVSDMSRGTPTRFSTPLSPRTAFRRRKNAAARAAKFVAQPAAAPLRLAPRPKKKPLIDVNSEDVQDAVAHGLAASVRYGGSIFTDALRLLRKPLGIFFFLWMMGTLVYHMESTFRKLISPVCWAPFISSSSLCRVPRASVNDALPPPQWADYPRLVEVQSASFADLFDGTVGGSALSLDIKRAEMATKDLVTLVKYSELRSRDHLAESLLAFVEDAKKTGKGLQRLTSKIDGAVDKIMAVNDYALHTIEGAQEQPNSLMRVIWPFGAPPPTQDAVVSAFRDSMEVHAIEMARLVLEIERSSENLDRLDEHLAGLHELCTREKLTLSASREQLLSELWTKLGGNSSKLRKFSTNLELLKELGEYRKRARAHVAAAMQTIQAMSEDMEDLRERVAAPEIVGDRIPIEVHMKSISNGMDRLREQRIRAREREEQLMNKILGVDA